MNLNGKNMFRVFSLLSLGVIPASVFAGRMPASEAQPRFPVSPYISKKQPAQGQRCQYSPLCPDGRAIFWGQQRLNADLMFQYLNERGIDNSKVKVAVVDSGFDWENQRHNILSSNFRVAKGHDKAGSEKRDPNGHGTAVAGLISSVNGVGLAPHVELTVYRVTSRGDQGTASPESINKSIQRACDDGNTIINVSWGGFHDEHGLSEIEESEKEFYNGLYEKGCLVLKSSGNDAQRDERAHMTLNDALLRVEASQINSFESNFSSRGEVRAPGSGVFTLRSTQVDSLSYLDFCGTSKRGAFVSGTSFSSPLTAAVAAQVQAVLQTQSRFSSLEPKEKVDWITRILAASAENKNIDANRAVRIADIVATRIRLGSALMAVEELKKLFRERNSLFCSNPLPRCAHTSSCDQWRSCLTQARAKYSRCPADQTKIAAHIFSLAQQTQAIDVVVGLLANDTRSSTEAKQQRSAQAAQIWGTLYPSWFKRGAARVPFDLGLDLLPHLVESRSQNAITHHKQIFADYFQSKSVLERLARKSKDRGEEDVKRFVDWLDLYKSVHGRLQLFERLNESFKRVLDPRQHDSSPALGLAATTRVWAELVNRESPDFQLKPELVQLGKVLIESIQRIELTRMPWDTRGFDTLFERQEMQSLGQGLLSRYMDELIRSPQIKSAPLNLLDWYVFEKMELLVPAENQPATLLAFMERFQWGEGSVEYGTFWFLKEVTQKFYEIAADRDNPVVLESDIQEYWKMVLEKDHLMYWTTVLPKNGHSVKYGSHKEISYDNAILQGSHVDGFLKNAYDKIQKDRSFRLKAIAFICDFLSPSFEFYNYFYRDSPERADELYRQWISWGSTKVIQLPAGKTPSLPHGFEVLNCVLDSKAATARIKADPKLVGKIQLAIDSLKSRGDIEAERHGYSLGQKLETALSESE